MYPLQSIEVDCVLVNPHALQDFVLAGSAMPVKEGLVEQGELVVRPRITVGRAAVKRTHVRVVSGLPLISLPLHRIRP